MHNVDILGKGKLTAVIAWGVICFYMLCFSIYKYISVKKEGHSAAATAVNIVL